MKNKNEEKIYKVYNAEYNMKNRFKRNFIFLIVLGIIIINLCFVLADGGYFPRPGYWVTPGQQRAVIFHEDNTETMILTSVFKGNAKDLVWIVPTPTKPEITKANEKVFTNAQKLAYPKYANRGIGFAEVMSVAKGAGDMNQGVYVISSKQVDYYDVKVLIATSSQDLVKWFNDNKYSYPKEYSYVLESYINKGWYFTAIRVSPEAQGATEVIQDLKEGNPTPIKMVFLSDKIVFPLKISSVNFPNNNEKKYGSAKEELIGATRTDSSGYIWTKKTNDVNLANWCRSYPTGGESCNNDYYIDQQPGGINYVDSNDYNYRGYTPIQLYVFADGKYEADGFYIQYGNWVKKNDINKLGNDDSGNPFIEPKDSKYYLTSLSANMQKSQMDEDIYLTKAENNKKVNAGPEIWELFLQGMIWGLVVFIVWIFTPPLGILFIVGILILFFSVTKPLRILGWIIGIISFVLTFIIGAFFFLIAAISGSLGDYIVVSLTITWLLILVLMIIFSLLAIRYRRQ
jgi:hypothetical protein